MNQLVTLQEAKDFCKVTSSSEDNLLSALILRASAIVESRCNRRFSLDTYHELYSGDGGSSLTLDNFPVVDVCHLSQDIDKETKTTNDLESPNDFAVQVDTGIVELFDDTFGDSEVRNVYIKYTAGYASIPDDIKNVVLDLVAKKRLDVQDKRIGVYSKGTMGDTITFSYKDINDTDDQILQEYRKFPSRKGIAVTGWSVQS